MEYVKIGPEFFKKSRKDYSDWCHAWIREIIQNSVDAKSTLIKINIVKEEELVITVSDNGCGMDVDTLRNKLLSLGSSGKNFEDGAVGGFGKAKELLYFGQKKYTIHTNNILVQGCGGEYTVSTCVASRKGTESTVTMDTDDTHDFWYYKVLDYLKRCTVNCKFIVNDTEYVLEPDNSTQLIEKPFGTIHKTERYSRAMVVRVNGLEMFSRYCSLEYGIIVNIAYDSLCANRDTLIWEMQRELNQFCDELACEKKSVLRKEAKLQKIIYSSKKGRIRIASERDHKLNTAENRTAMLSRLGTVRTTDTAEVTRSEVETMYDFVVESSSFVLDAWTPENFCSSAKWLYQAWAVAVWEVHRAYNYDPDYAIGFLIEPETVAAHQRQGNIFYINPCDDNYQALYDRDIVSAAKLLSSAIHEFTHSLGHGAHDEGFAGATCRVVEKVLASQDKILNKIINPQKHELFMVLRA